MPEGDRRQLLRDRGPAALADAGVSWERLSGWLPGGMDAEAWEAVIPSMGVMALVRNLRNFDQAGISEPSIDAVIAKITDADEVAKARLFPYQVWAAYKHAPSDAWKRALGRTLELHRGQHPCPRWHPRRHRHLGLDAGGGVRSIHAAAGRDRRGHGRWRRHTVPRPSMSWSTARRTRGCGAGAAHRCSREVEQIVRSVGSVGHATFGHTAIKQWYDPDRHRRVVLFTDDQQHDAGQVRLEHVPLIYTFDLGGYRPSALPAGERGRYTLGGFTDATFKAMEVLEGGRNAQWPF